MVVVQVLTGHFPAGAYLARFGHDEDIKYCHWCEEEDTIQHWLLECWRHEDLRVKMKEEMRFSNSELWWEWEVLATKGISWLTQFLVQTLPYINEQIVDVSSDRSGEQLGIWPKQFEILQVRNKQNSERGIVM